MKTKILIIVTISALISLSFAFTGKKAAAVKNIPETSSIIKREPTGGFAMEDKM